MGTSRANHHPRGEHSVSTDSRRGDESVSPTKPSTIATFRAADLTLVDPNAEEVISTDSLHYRHRQSPYVGRKLRAPVVRTILRGQTIFERGKLIGKAKGQFVRPEKT